MPLARGFSRTAVLVALVGQLTTAVGVPVFAAVAPARGGCRAGNCSCSILRQHAGGCCCTTPAPTPAPAPPPAGGCPHCKAEAPPAPAPEPAAATLDPGRCRCDPPAPVAVDPAVPPAPPVAAAGDPASTPADPVDRPVAVPRPQTPADPPPRS
ncbi:hypothetical protein [Urbifossiella limnaea]|nr:hypothetical protein [Urbifossiella limnaea]